METLVFILEVSMLGEKRKERNMGEDIYIASDNNVGWNNQTLFSSRAARGGGGAKKREMLTPHLVWRGKKGGRRIREANWNS